MFKSRRLKKIFSLLVTAIFMFGVAQISQANSSGKKTFKCWTNKEGIRECGNVVPPEYAQKGHEEVNVEGRVVDKVERAKTVEELKEAARLKAIEQSNKKKAELQARYDHALLSTYSNTDDMIMARDGKIRAVDSSIKLANDKIASLVKAMEGLKTQAAHYERTGKPLPKVLQEDMDLTQGKIDRQKDLIDEKQKEKEDIKLQFESDIERFNELKGDVAQH
ncbi:MAG: hypothetical protein OEW89_02475 [Gammaproteobacteria bacterium]|nr:hypothetical protein [Gammaproteobacteria bacterium]MDH5594425.1 hypothetical protein [Gammaproteobacteria bacterium]